MTTSSKELAAEFNDVNGTIADIRDDFRLPCPNGFICEGVKQADCAEVRKLFNDTERLGLGDIMAGIWCPRENNTLRNCPLGSYCPDSKTKLPCPEGFFCPHKTEVPVIKCPACSEGSKKLVAAKFGWYLFGVGLGLVAVYIVFKLVFKYWLEQVYKLGLVQRQAKLLGNAADRINIFDHQREKRMKRIRPTLETLASKMEESGIGTKKVKNDILKITEIDDPQFHSQALRALFNALDDDDTGTLSYNQFNSLLGMNQVQLQQFIGGMNSRAGLDYDTKVLTRAVFVKNFLPVLEECSHFAPDEEDAMQLFDDMAKYEKENKVGSKKNIGADEGSTGDDSNEDSVEIRFETFREKDFFHFLSQQQTNDLMKRFRWLRTQQNKALQKANSEQARGRLTTLKVGGFSRAESSRDGLTISRQEFIKNYPKLLKEVVTTNAARRDSKSGEISNGTEEECTSIDIAFENLCLSVQLAKQKVYIVDHVTGRLRAKTMTALMGGSGAGKTSLLNALCGRAFYGLVEGKIWINGQEASIEEHKDAVGFVPQDDTVYAELTVKENLIYSGKFRSERGTDILDIEDYAESVLNKLGLVRVQDTIVGDVTRRGVSGGEKKRVNIGIELMGQPSVIFLDEPTSGLDASSALLVMSSLKKLVETNGVTVCSVIHQPRKVIFDLFDSLILLSVGGKMCYTGPTAHAKAYFESMGYELPEGESVADWMIDISSGQLEPEEEMMAAAQPRKRTSSAEVQPRKRTTALGILTKPNLPNLGDARKRASAIGLLSNVDEVGAGAVSTMEDDEYETQALRREHLNKAWIEYFDKKNKNISKQSRKMFYSKPPATELPPIVEKPGFLEQLWFQLDRALLVGRRNAFSKLVDTLIIVSVGIIISIMQSTTILSIDADPSGIRFKYLVTEDPALILSDDNDNFFEQLFAYAMGADEDFRQYGLKVGVILAVIVGLTATKPITEKRVEFFREAGSGYNVNAYFLAINITTTIEHSVQLLLVGATAYWMRDAISGPASYLVSFLLLAWLTVSWALLLSVAVPPKNIFTVVGFFMAFSGLLFSGASPPVLYYDLYNSPALALFCGFFSPARYFTESLAVSEQRCLPAQSGFTQDAAPNFPPDGTSFSILGLAQNDSHVGNQTCDGWFWYVLPCIFAGLTVRVAAGGLIHVVGRSQQAKKSYSKIIAEELRSPQPKWTTFICVLYGIILIGLSTLTSWLILRKV